MKVMEYKTTNFTKIDAINAASADSLKNIDNGSTIQVNKIGTYTDKESEAHVTVLCTVEGYYYSSISATVYDQTDDLIDLLNENDSIIVMINKRKGGKGEYIMLTVVEVIPYPEFADQQ